MKDTKLLSLLVGAGITLASGNSSAQVLDLDSEAVLRERLHKTSSTLTLKSVMLSCDDADFSNGGCGNNGGCSSNSGCGR